MDKKRVITNIVAPIVGLAVFILIWYIVALSIGISIILPTPAETLGEFFKLFADGSFYLAVGTTLGRTLLGFLVAFILASLFAFLSSRSRFARNMFAPFAVILRVLPTISVILLVLIWFRSALAPYVITFLVIFPMLYKIVLDAIDNVDVGLIEMANVYHLSASKRFTYVYLPEMTPSLLTGAGITLSFSVKLTVAAEVLAYTRDSLGRNLQQASAYIETAKLLAWTLVAILLGFLLEGAVLLVKKLLVRHYYGQ